MSVADNSETLRGASAGVTYSQLRDNVAAGTYASAWLEIEQTITSDFGRLTRDPDPNHIDPDWARAHSPFGGPIAFGFQTLAMLTWLAKSAGVVPADATHVVNYGFDRVRFVAPIPVGRRIRGQFQIADLWRRSATRILVTYDVTVVVEHAGRPALRALWLALYEGQAERG